jgi:glycerol uptake facilitator-like aquaporin
VNGQDHATLGRRLAAEAVGTALLLAAVVGSGIMAESLAGGNVALALLANTMATAAALVALILTFGPVSGAHFNPAVTGAEWVGGRLRPADAAAYIGAQCMGAIVGVMLAHGMFAQPVVTLSQHVRTGLPQILSEAVATFGLIATILGTSRHRPAAVPFAVGAYIAAAYWFTASTSFANPAVTLGRSLTDTFAGIRPADVLGFVGAQIAGATVALGLFRWLLPPCRDAVTQVGGVA